MKKKGILTFVIGIVVLALIAGSAHCNDSKTLAPIADTYVNDSAGFYGSTENYGSSTYLEVSNTPRFPLANGVSIAFLMFNLTDIPSNVTIETVELRLYSDMVAQTYAVSAYYCPDNSWTEFTLTYRNMPSYSDTVLDTVNVVSYNKWYEWNVTSAVLSALQVQSNRLSLALGGDFHAGSTAGSVWFYSRDQLDFPLFSTTQYEPQLVISYKGTTQNPTPQTPIWGYAIAALILFGVPVIVIVLVVRFIIKRRKKKAPPVPPPLPP